MREVLPWIKYKRTFIGMVLLEIGERLRKGLDGFLLCTTFVTHTKDSLHDWAMFFTERYCESGKPTRLSQIALQELKEIVDFVQLKSRRVCPKEERVSLKYWFKHFNSSIKNRIKISPEICVLFGDDQVITDIEFFVEEVAKGLGELHARLEKILSTITSMQTTHGHL